jgi:hypothetical protein
MRWISLAIFAVTIFNKKVHGQAGQDEIIRMLFSDGRQISNFSYVDWKFVPESERPFNEQPQYLLKNKHGLYVFLNGTGRLYEVVPGAERIDYVRVDSTRHFGYNIGSFPFVFRDTLYNLGGYGLWRINGQLRAYVPKTEQWDIVKLNREIPLMYGWENTLLWYDLNGGRVFIGFETARDEAVRDTALSETHFTYRVSCLDLLTKNWKELGTLSSYIKELVPTLANITSSPWGQLLLAGNKFMILDYANNRVMSFKPATEQLIVSALAPHIGSHLFYFKDSVLFAANLGLGRLDSFTLSIKNFDVTTYPVFDSSASMRNQEKNVTLLFWLSLFISTSFGGLVYYYLLRRARRFSSDKLLLVKEQPSEHSSHLANLRNIRLEQRELSVLYLIYSNSSNAETTSIDEINRALGLTRRSTEIQKKQRSEVIASVNKKFKYIFATNRNVLQKQRSTFDKRSFDYFIDNDYFHEAGTLLAAADEEVAPK